MGSNYPRFEQYWTIICFFFLIISNLEIDYIPDVSFMLYNSMLISYRSSQNAFRNNYQMIKFLRWVTKLHNTKIHQTERKTNILSFFYNRQYGAKVRTCISQLPVIYFVKYSYHYELELWQSFIFLFRYTRWMTIGVCVWRRNSLIILPATG